MADVKLALRGRIVTMDAAGTVIKNGVLWIAGSRIAAVTSATASTPAGFAGIVPLATKSLRCLVGKANPDRAVLKDIAKVMLRCIKQ